MKVALVYDRVNKWGGAERVLLALHKIFPNAPLYTAVYDKKNAGWAREFDVKPSFLQGIPLASTNHELLPTLMPLAFESFEFDQYDLVVSVTSESAKGIITHPGTKHICYCLTPTRYLWSGYEEYFEKGALRFFSKPFVSSLRKWDIVAAKRPDAFIAISKEVQKRIKKYYGRESDLVYPPASLGESKDKNSPFTLPPSPYFLVVSRLSRFTKYKRIDLAIKAANNLQIPLKVVGDGNWRQDLEKMSGPTIEFLGNIDDEMLIDLYKGCKALVFPGLEDLGLVMIEAQSFGKPVIAYNAGGANEIVVNGQTGILFDNQTEKGLSDAIEKFEKETFDPENCRKNAEKFSFENFKKNFLFVIEKLI